MEENKILILDADCLQLLSAASPRGAELVVKGELCGSADSYRNCVLYFPLPDNYYQPKAIHVPLNFDLEAAPYKLLLGEMPALYDDKGNGLPISLRPGGLAKIVKDAVSHTCTTKDFCENIEQSKGELTIRLYSRYNLYFGEKAVKGNLSTSERVCKAKPEYLLHAAETFKSVLDGDSQLDICAAENLLGIIFNHNNKTYEYWLLGKEVKNIS